MTLGDEGMAALRRTILELVQLSVAVMLGLALAPALISAASNAVFSVKPIVYDWTITSYSVAGDDVLLSGYARKRWPCDYTPPPRAFDEGGVALRIETSSTTRTSWPADGELRRWGTWRVVGGAGHKLTFYQANECWGFLDVFTRLGELDVRVSK